MFLGLCVLQPSSVLSVKITSHRRGFESTRKDVDDNFSWAWIFRLMIILLAIRSLLMWYFIFNLAVSFSSWVFGIFDRFIFVRTILSSVRTASFRFWQLVCPIRTGGGVGLNRFPSVRSLVSSSPGLVDRSSADESILGLSRNNSLLRDRYFWNCSSIFSKFRWLEFLHFSLFKSQIQFSSLFHCSYLYSGSVLDPHWVITVRISSILLQ